MEAYRASHTNYDSVDKLGKSIKEGNVSQPRERTGIMLGYKYLRSRLKKYGKPWIIQPKFEGDRRRAIFDDCGNVRLMTSSAALSFSTPHIQKACEALGFRNVELDGEIYKHGMRHSEIRKRAAPTKNLHSDHESLEYHIFDVILPDAPGDERQKVLDDLAVLFKPPLFRAETHYINDEAELESWYHALTEPDENGHRYEGIIIRNPRALYERHKWWGGFMKLKPQLQDMFVAVGYRQEVDKSGQPKDALGALILRGLEKEHFSVGSGFTRNQRIRLWQNREMLKGKLVLINFQDYTLARKVPKMASFKAFVRDGKVCDWPWK